MEIRILSGFEFDQNLYDKAFGVAKSLIVTHKKTKVKRWKGFVITAKKKDGSVFVNILKETE